jgi:hypothetical protein
MTQLQGTSGDPITTVDRLQTLINELKRAGGGGQCNQAIQIEGAIISFPIDLERCKFDKPVAFIACRFEQPVRFRRAHFVQVVSFRESRFDHSLEFLDDPAENEKTFEAHLVSRSIDIKTFMDGYQLVLPDDGTYHDFRSIRVEGDLRFGKVTATSSINLMRARVEGTLDCMGLKIETGSLWLDQIHVAKSLNLQSPSAAKTTKVGHAVLLNHAKVEGPVWARGLEATHFLASASDLAALHLDSRQPAQTGVTKIAGWLWLSGTTIRNILDISGGEFVTCDLYAAHVHAAILGELDKAEKWSPEVRRTVITKELILRSTEVGGNILLAGIEVGKVDAFQLKCDGLVFEPWNEMVAKNAVPEYRPKIGELWVRQSEIAGDLLVNYPSAPFRTPANQALPLAHVDAINLSGTRIGGELGLAEINCTGRLVAAGISVGGNATLEDSQIGTAPATPPTDEEHDRAAAVVDLEDSQFGRELCLVGTHVKGPLSLRGAVVRGSVFSDEHRGRDRAEEIYPQVSGNVRLESADLAQVFIRFDKQGASTMPREINLTAGKVRMLHIAGCIPGTPRIVARELEIGQITFDEEVTIAASRRDGTATFAAIVAAVAYVAVAIAVVRFGAVNHFTRWQWAGIALAAVIGVVMPLIAWLAAMSRSEDRLRTHLRRTRALLNATWFGRELYVRVEEWYRTRGHDAEADELFRARRRRESGLEKGGFDRTTGRGRHEPTSSSPADRLWRYFIDFSIGFGTRPHRLLYVWLMVALVTFTLFQVPRSVSHPVSYSAERIPVTAATQPSIQPSTPPSTLPPTRPVWETDAGGNPSNDDSFANPSGRSPVDWGADDSFWMTLRLHIPLIEQLSRGDWAPSGEQIVDGAPWWRSPKFESYATFVQIFSWIAVPLWLAGVTGLLKRVQ